MFDPGCTHSIMSSSLADKLELPVTPYTGIYSVANDTVSSYHGKVDDFQAHVYP